LIQHVAEANPDIVAMRQKDETGQWRQWTYQNLDEEVQIVAKALIEIGLHRHHSVAIMGSNSPHWIIANLAAISSGGIAAGLHQGLSAEEVARICIRPQSVWSGRWEPVRLS